MGGDAPCENQVGSGPVVEFFMQACDQAAGQPECASVELCGASQPVSLWSVLFIAAVSSDDACYGEAICHYGSTRRTVYDMHLRSLVPPVVALATAWARRAKNGHQL